MAAEHAPPPGGGAGHQPAASARGAESALDATHAATALQPTGRSTAHPDANRGGGGATGRGSRLLPSGPALEHAPMLLGLDAAGGEHPQGGDHEDDEDLVGRVWGCGCGWRGAVRDVSTRPFHPRVGDGGGLRRQRLARSDRDSRAELEAHLARGVSKPADPPTAVSPAPAPSIAPNSAAAEAPQQLGDARPRGRRRRLTVPRDVPLAISPVTALPAAQEIADDHRGAPLEHDADTAPTVEPEEPPRSDTARATPETRASPAAKTVLEPATASGGAESGERNSIDLLQEVVARIATARAELTAAETALDAAVIAAREDGLSWRTIGRATRLGHGEAAARWGTPGEGPSL